MALSLLIPERYPLRRVDAIFPFYGCGMTDAPSRRDRRRDRRIARAEADRRRALSPMRILLRIAVVPLVAGAVAVSIYIRTSDFPPEQAMLHLYALAGCDAAASVGLAPAFRGGVGYHARNDPDGDGIACLPALPPRAPAAASQPSTPAESRAGGAKFIRP